MGDYREYVVFIDNSKFKYHIKKEFEPTTNAEWYDFIDANLCSAAEKSFLLNSMHIRIYTILPSVGDSLLITEFDTSEVLILKGPGYRARQIQDNENDGYISYGLDLQNNEEKHIEEGVKYDNGKPLVGTMLNVFPYALMEIGRVIEFGTHKYPSPTNWKLVDDAKIRYQDALMRHLLKHNQGKEIDEETGKPHLAHAAWNALALLELYLIERQNGGQENE